ncbi:MULTISPECIES: diacylglycerol kinase family protein [unclassified Lactococcus]|uniref:diacylglycerol/lipid kinase family protein n=1 Tax=unclassified Lactococcus TaxID=2643510 RepID=UPI0011CC9FB2|nr:MULTISPECIES: diacylglycerol kinase family protein [unclassified Lactococcus]MQW22114.1 YegS/Rv2252/BmrU family lipid kinase [Lactococcus sp. dk101]TXK45053.1 diacylglycerol kinase family lipid kinase [Lactococcus sp. dk310]TXK51167.1 diacylglycerol kinase family lipid kinase [Lactococcus sp. dk322]
MTYFILANPNSGAKKGAHTLDVLLPYFNENQIKYQLFATSEIGQEAQLINAILELKTSTDQLLIIGGDGTISLAIDALPDHIPFAYIPAGSGNDFARSLHISLDPIEAFKNIERQEKHDIYIIKYSSHQLSGYALNNIGIGLDAQIVKSANEGKLKTWLNKIKLGQLAYLMTALHVLFTKKPFAVHLSALTNDNKVQEKAYARAFLMTFTKHPYFGGGVKISPEASNSNAEIHLVEFDRHPMRKIFPVVPKVLKGTHLTNPLFDHRISKTFTVTTDVNQPVQIDGETHEILKNDPLTLSTEKRTIIY